MQRIKLILGAAVTVGLVGCAGDPEQTYTETVVHLNPDGTQTVTHGTVTLSEELRQNAARAARAGGGDTGVGTAAEAITTDGACAGADMWIYDQTGNVGNRICFIGSGVADLSTFIHNCWPVPGGFQCSHWNAYVRSYWAGVDWGYFQSATTISCATPAAGHCPAFAPYHQGLTLTSCESSSTHFLNLDGVCVCSAGQAMCSGACVNVTTDSNNCGACGNVCQGGKTCSGGACVCPAPKTPCNGVCVDLTTDSSNCGACGNACQGESACCVQNGQPSCQPEWEPYCCGQGGADCGTCVPMGDEAQCPPVVSGNQIPCPCYGTAGSGSYACGVPQGFVKCN